MAILSTLEQMAVIKATIDQNLEPFYTAHSLHIYEERFNVNGTVYSFLNAIGCEEVEVELYEEPLFPKKK
jgi:hypothetical protein